MTEVPVAQVWRAHRDTICSLQFIQPSYVLSSGADNKVTVWGLVRDDNPCVGVLRQVCSGGRRRPSRVRRAAGTLLQERAGGGGGWHKASVSDCLPLAAPIGLSPLLILTLRGSEPVLVGGWEGGR